MNYQALRRFFIGKVEPGSVEEFESALARKNVISGKICFVFFAIFELINIISILSKGIATLNNRVYFALYLILEVVALITTILCFCGRFEKVSGRRIIWYTFFYGEFISLWSIALSLWEMRRNPGIYTFVLTALALSMLVNLRPFQSIILFGVNQIILLSLAPLFVGPDVSLRGIVVNSTAVSFTSILIALTRHYGQQTDYRNRCIIDLQNKEITEMNRQLNRLVMTDELSKLHNRRFLDEVMPSKWESCMENELPVAVVMLDIDDFKAYNDNNGHQCGDQCIRQLSDVMLRCTSLNTDYLIRYGGEEFSMIFIDKTLEQVRKIAEDVREEIEKTRINAEGVPDVCGVTVSQGVYQGIPNPDNSLEDFFRNADRALYEAKRSGKNRVVIYEQTSCGAFGAAAGR